LAGSDYVRLEVSDTGSGMTPELQARIFDPFFTTKQAGRGLGLAAVQGIIRNHGGLLNIQSTPGQGSRFEILMPCVDLAAPQARVAGSANESEIASGSVLFIEDEEVLRVGVSRMLRKAGYSVIEAGDGITGTSLFRASPSKIDVVLLDVTLPGMPGSEVLDELRRIQPKVKVILTTALTQEKAHSLLGKQPAWGYIRKPYQLSELASLLRKALDKQTMRVNAAG
jgi:CheY-like chemotaxis protein